MKPSKVLSLAILCLLIGLIWTFTIIYRLDWYIVHVQNDILMGILILLALLMLFGGFILILSKLE
jgi:hypothetical protein